MNWLRNRLRAWLGIPSEQYLRDLQRRVEEIEKQPTFADISRKQFEIENALREFKEVRDQVLDPKRVPIRTTRSAQFRVLMEQEP